MDVEQQRTVSALGAPWTLGEVVQQCDGQRHRESFGGHVASAAAAFAVSCRCSCGLDRVMNLCAGRVSHVLQGGHPMECGECGTVSTLDRFWWRIVPLGADPELWGMSNGEGLGDNASGDDSASETGQRDAELQAIAQNEPAGCADNDAQWLQLFEQELRASGATEKTLTGMLSTLRTLRSRSGVSFAEITREQLLQFLAAPGWQPATRRTYRTTLTRFFRWAADEGLRSGDPAARLPRVKLPYSEPNPLTTAEVQLLLSSGMYRKGRLMVLLAAYQGLRASEIAALHSDDIDLEAGMLTVVNGKGGSTLRRPLHRLVLEQLRELDASGYLFPSPNGGHVKGTAVSKSISTAMRRVGLEGHRPHQLRSWHATELVRAGVDTVTVQHSMRHATLGTLHKYVHPSAADIDAALEQLPAVDVPRSTHRKRRERD